VKSCPLRAIRGNGVGRRERSVLADLSPTKRTSRGSLDGRVGAARQSRVQLTKFGIGDYQGPTERGRQRTCFPVNANTRVKRVRASERRDGHPCASNDIGAA
jgi:hypothetical protein